MCIRDRFCISLVRSALQAVHYTVWRTDTQLGSRGGLVRRYEMRLRLSQLNYADLRRSPATWALHYCPVFVSAGACRPEPVSYTHLDVYKRQVEAFYPTILVRWMSR